MLIDTDVLIWYMRGNRKAFKAVEALDGFEISVVTYVELVQGLRNKAELNTLKNFLQSKSASILHVTDSISATAMFLVEQYHFGHSLELADALIAATALSHGLPLFTGNARHYQPVKNLVLKMFKPYNQG
jgi:predicted nucleic acid-binding protein